MTPPILNKNTKLSPHIIGGSNCIDPLYNVANQLNTFTAVGTATKNVMNEKIAIEASDIPDVNIW